jgi:prolyl 4-hydroxylase
MDISQLIINDNLIRHEVCNIQNCFVGGWYTKEDNGLLDRINDWFDKEYELGNYDYGRIGDDGRIDPEHKDGIETILDRNPELYKEYVEEYLTPVLQCYNLLYPHSAQVDCFDVNYAINLQEYPPNSKGYSKWHAEVEGMGSADRHLVFMTYLNDVDDRGDTQFWYQNLNIKPEKGLTIFFPSGWTHVHRGLSSPTQHKRFLTGWYSYDRK